MLYKYLYIDDTNNNIEQGTINALQDGNEIEITFRKPNDWETQLLELKVLLPSKNGIILDLRLNDVPYKDNMYAQYRGSTVAQELRTLAKEGEFKMDFPIILISANENLQKSLDQSSLDLFDFCVSKNKLEQINGITYSEFRKKLKWLADGYDYLNKSERTINEMLNLKNSDFLDIRFIETFSTLIDKPVHTISKFLISELIFRPGILINENYLSARFGVNIKASEDWPNLLSEYLSGALYSGAFFNYYPRWWMKEVELFWQNKISGELNLRTLSATQRVELLIDKTGLRNLEPLSKQGKSKSDSFWIVCKGTGVAIDTIDGFIITGQDDRHPWQEAEYISLDEALRPKHQEVWKNISSIEKPRLQKLKELLERSEQRKG